MAHTRQISNSPLELDYILIIEWLEDDDPRTGQALHEWIHSQLNPPLTSKHVRCLNATDVLRALENAAEDVSRQGNPIVHFECHGYPAENGGAGGLSGSRTNGERLPWEDIWNALRTLNLASGYNLIVVVAACSGDLVTYGVNDSFKFITGQGVQGALPLPFMAALGFLKTVHPSSVRNSLKEFYRCLFRRPVIVGAVDDANRELQAGEQLLFLWTGEVAAGATAQLVSGQVSESNAAWLRRDCPGATDAEVARGTTLLDALMKDVGYQVMSRMLGYDTHPENKKRFPWAPQGKAMQLGSAPISARR